MTLPLESKRFNSGSFFNTARQTRNFSFLSRSTNAGSPIDRTKLPRTFSSESNISNSGPSFNVTNLASGLPLSSYRDSSAAYLQTPSRARSLPSALNSSILGRSLPMAKLTRGFPFSSKRCRPGSPSNTVRPARGRLFESLKVNDVPRSVTLKLARRVPFSSKRLNSLAFTTSSVIDNLLSLPFFWFLLLNLVSFVRNKFNPEVFEQSIKYTRHRQGQWFKVKHSSRLHPPAKPVAIYPLRKHFN